MKIRRGVIYSVDLGDGVGSEQRGTKYCLVVQNDTGNKHSTTTVVLPITKEFKGMPTHVELLGVLPLESYILCEQIRTVSKDRFNYEVARVPGRVMQQVEDVMIMQLGIFRKEGK